MNTVWCMYVEIHAWKERSILVSNSPVVAGSFFGFPHHTPSGLAGLLFPVGRGL